MSDLILFGAGTVGRIIARNNKERVLCFADNNPKGAVETEGIHIFSPELCKRMFPDATWIASAIIPEYHQQICEEIERMGVKTIPVWGFLPQRTTPPPHNVALQLLAMVVHDKESYDELCDQIDLRRNPQTHQQRPPSDIRDIYFPEFIAHREDEHYLDAGAADADTVMEFRKRWDKWSLITAIEPDMNNYKKLRAACADSEWTVCWWGAISDFNASQTPFSPTGDYSAHLGSDGSSNHVYCNKLDDMNLRTPPTYIKMDIEGSELAALWGTRRILKEHSPVLAICAYHESSHLWEIPLLIHALQPEYELFFRRYAQGSFEIVWYAVPPERVKR